MRLTIFTAMAFLAAGTFAGPLMELRAVQDNCYELGDCYSSGCEGVFAEPNDTQGTCSAGTYAGCPCEKCGGSDGSYTGSCTDNACMGIQGTCSAGNYQGCTCN